MDEPVSGGKTGETVVPFPGSPGGEVERVVVADQVITMHQGLPGQSQKLTRAVRAQDVTRACLAASMDAALKLISWINDPDPQVSLKAIAMVMDRGLGKAVQTVNLTDETDPEMKGMIEFMKELLSRRAVQPKGGALLEHQPFNDALAADDEI
jgi:hypothetical protein